ncbi:MAG: HAMP domain-containing histidine kinase [Clostridium sp.]|nr:HAMP domain-containing histidine kinase [Clostridium sp.]
MEVWLWAVIVILTCVILILCIKIYALQKAAKEIQEGLTEKLTVETNTLISISSRDKQMRRLAESLNEQLRILRDKRHYYMQGDLRLKEAVTNISHDIRTPLTAIGGYLELMRKLLAQMSKENREDDRIEAAERYLDIMENRTGVLKRLTDELLKYSVAASKEQDLPYEDVVLNHVLEESISAYYAILKDAGITPVIKMPDSDVKSRLNKNALSRILGNIIENAIKYSNGDLRITLLDSGEMTFANYAPALDEVQVGKLFDRFYTVDTAAKSTGIGLSIARTLTEQMGGAISADYEEGMLCIRLLFSQNTCIL